MCPLPDDSSSRLAHPAVLNEFSPQERTLLLQVAHQAVTAVPIPRNSPIPVK